MAMYARDYESDSDYARMRVLIRNIYALAGPPVYCTVGDLDWWRVADEGDQALRHSHLWFEEDRVIGIAWPEPLHHQVDVMVHPDHNAMIDDMLAWAEEQCRQTEPAATQRLVAWAFDGDQERQAILKRRGYAHKENYSAFYMLDLGQTFSAPKLPKGYAVRSVLGEEDLEKCVAVHHMTSASSKMTEQRYRRLLKLPTYSDDLDLVVTAPDGNFAAFATVWYDEANGIGLFEPVGCRPDHRRRGLVTAVMQEGLRRLQALGAQNAIVQTQSGNHAAQALYRSFGFRLLDRNYAWEKNLI